ncbi:MAG TPA: hypothetical protein VJ951_02580 [Bacteroidales bacterium]|nr:hypothetical protein [Bacteroidales bacterium]
MRARFISALLLIFAISIFTRCDNTEYLIPYVRIDLHLNIIGELGNPAITSYVLVDGGVNGLIVYREDYGNFHVYDRTCTQYPDHNTKVMPDEDFEGVFTCPECESKYMLLNGASPISGPATFALHEYVSVVEGDLLHIYN